MTDDHPGVLVPIEILEGESVPEQLVDLLSAVPVVLLGYHVLPEQTAPGQARVQFEERAQAVLDNAAEGFRAAGVEADTRLVFTHDREATVDRVAEGTGCEAVLLANPTGTVERLLLPVEAGTDTTRIAGFVAALLGDRAIDVTVYAVGPPEERSTADAVVDALRESGLPAGAVHTEIPDAEPSTEAIVTAATDHDVVVMAQDTSLRGLLFGELPEQVAAHSLGPVFVVRRLEDDTTEP